MAFHTSGEFQLSMLQIAIQYGVRVCMCVVFNTFSFWFLLQKWARAWTECNYHLNIHTNNGVESQNKVLKVKLHAVVQR